MTDEDKNADVIDWSNEALAKFLEDYVVGSVDQCEGDRAVNDEDHKAFQRERDAVFEAAERLLRNVSPDMLEALEELINASGEAAMAIPSLDEPVGVFDRHNDAMTVARAAVAKAKGVDDE